MDTSGLANVVFGYFADQVYIWPLTEEIIAVADQFVNEQSWGQGYDNPDDRIQRQVGNALSQAVRSGEQLNASLIIQKAIEAGLR